MKITSWARRATSRAAILAWALSGGFACQKVGGPPAEAPPGLSTADPHGPVAFAFDSLDERPVGSEATRGKPTLLAFVTTANLACQAQLDFLIAMAQNDADRVNYAAVALEPREGRELVELYRKALAIPFPVAMADAQTLAGAGPFGDLATVPVTILLDRLGRVVWRTEGRVAKSHELRGAMRGL